MLNEFICYSRGVRSFVTFTLFLMENPVIANNADPDHIPYSVASDLGPYFLPMTLYRLPDKNGLS